MDELRVIFEDDYLIAFDKPAGLLIAPDRWDKSAPNLMARVHSTMSPLIYNAHRLDRDTSGLVVCAKNKPTLDRLCSQFERGEVHKEYLALARGRPPAKRGVIERAIVPDAERPGKMKCVRRGKRAVTVYEVVKAFNACVLLRLQPRTGRTHQLRVHLKWLGCPIVADPWYGDGRPLMLSEFKPGYKPPQEGERPLLARLALHAHRLVLRHPATGESLALEAPLPRDFKAALRQLEKWAAFRE